jgi:tannase
VPTTLKAKHLASEDQGQDAEIYAWSLRPLWIENGTKMECMSDLKRIDIWMLELDAWKVPLH